MGKRRRRRVRGWLRATLLSAPVATLLLGGCDAGPDRGEVPGGSEVVARVDGREIRLSELDASIRLALHDLARARYELRLGALRGLIAQQVAGEDVVPARGSAAGGVQVLLEPPEPPRFVLEIEGVPVRGDRDASVVVTLFCDFDAPACARIQPGLRLLEAEYSGRMRIEHRDLPASGRVQPGLAAQALGCAFEQDTATAFYDALYARPDRHDRGGLVRLAAATGLDAEALRACLDDGVQAARVVEGVVMARHLGVRQVPSAFVNGLYVSGADPQEVRRLVARELRRAGLDDAPRRLAASELGISVVGMVHRRDADQSLATLRISGEARSESFRPGETVVADVVLDEVRRDGVVLRRGERTEFLPIHRGSPTSRPPPAPEDAELELPDVAAAPPEPAEEPVPDDVHRVRLSRDAVDDAISRWEDLETALSPGVVDPDGRVLLELDDVVPGDFYDRLGLERGDVLMQVDGELIDERENPLWDVLAARSLVELVVARDGEPRIVDIEIE